MKTYTVLKPLYNERAGRVLAPGETVAFDPAQAAILAEKGVIGAYEQTQARRKRKRDAELEKIEDTDL